MKLVAPQHIHICRGIRERISMSKVVNKISSREMQRQAKAVLSELADLGAPNVLLVLNTAIGFAVSRSNRIQDDVVPNLKQIEKIRKRGRGRLHRVARDSELQSYIEGVNEYLPIKQLWEKLVAQFGEARVPSKSSLHRWIQARSDQ